MNPHNVSPNPGNGPYFYEGDISSFRPDVQPIVPTQPEQRQFNTLSERLQRFGGWVLDKYEAATRHVSPIEQTALDNRTQMLEASGYDPMSVQTCVHVDESVWSDPRLSSRLDDLINHMVVMTRGGGKSLSALVQFAQRPQLENIRQGIRSNIIHPNSDGLRLSQCDLILLITDGKRISRNTRDMLTFLDTLRGRTRQPLGYAVASINLNTIPEPTDQHKGNVHESCQHIAEGVKRKAEEIARHRLGRYDRITR